MKRSFLNLLYNIYIRVIGIVKPISLGVRVLLIQDDKVLMVRHTYQDEWFLVGGGMERGETLAEAARREALGGGKRENKNCGEFQLSAVFCFIRTPFPISNKSIPAASIS